MKTTKAPLEAPPRPKVPRGKPSRKRKKEPVDRALWLLSHLIPMAGLSRREVDQRLGLTRGQVGQVLTGRTSLRFEMILLILDEVGMEPALFFKLLFELPNEGDNPLLSLLYRKLLEGGAMKPEHFFATPEPAPLPSDELRRLVRQELADVLASAQRTAPSEERLREERSRREPFPGDMVESVPRKRTARAPRKKPASKSPR
ncbi:MAG TPA: helix-turn-helix transcriptional regulator [Thermoanaerobaculia bacterium]|nr:helix-turn-helix transcriptional regulator [Thermoanaerobaculia bacterium]